MPSAEGASRGLALRCPVACSACTRTAPARRTPHPPQLLRRIFVTRRDEQQRRGLVVVVVLGRPRDAGARPSVRLLLYTCSITEVVFTAR